MFLVIVGKFLLHSQSDRPARQRALRGRSWRDDPAKAAPQVRCPHPATPADRRVLRPGGEGQRAVLRAQAGVGDSLDQGTVDLRPRTNQHFTLKENPLRLEDLEAALAEFGEIASTLGRQ